MSFDKKMVQLSDIELDDLITACEMQIMDLEESIKKHNDNDEKGYRDNYMYLKMKLEEKRRENLDYFSFCPCCGKELINRNGSNN